MKRFFKLRVIGRIAGSCLALIITWLISTYPALAQDSGVEMDVYKDPSCGCCNGWIEHMNLNDFATNVFHPRDLNGLKQEHGIAPQLQSCHTAITEAGYVFEGHVPAKLIKQFLANPPTGAIGLTVPGMPVGTPGMEMGNRFTPYNVLLIKQDGSAEIYAEISKAEDQH